MLCHHQVTGERSEEDSKQPKCYCDGIILKYYNTSWSVNALIVSSFGQRCLPSECNVIM